MTLSMERCGETVNLPRHQGVDQPLADTPHLITGVSGDGDAYIVKAEVPGARPRQATSTDMTLIKEQLPD